MTSRTFKQLGQAYGSIPATITVVIDGVTVFNGTVPTLNTAMAAGVATDNVLFSWQKDITFAGVQKMEITVTNGRLRLESTVANCCQIPSASAPPSHVPGGSNVYSFIYSSNTEHGITTDPITNARINGTPVTRSTGADYLGQWWYVIEDGQTFQCDLNTKAGVEQTAWSSSRSYSEQQLVIHNDVWYFAKQDVPTGQDISSTSYWAALPLPAWNSGRSYGVMTTVQHQGGIYTSRFAVPADTDIANTNYWNDYNGDFAEIESLGIKD